MHRPRTFVYYNPANLIKRIEREKGADVSVENENENLIKRIER